MKAELLPPLPRVTTHEGIGGRIKSAAEYFCVTEIGDPSTPCADGKHAYVTLTRSSLTTREMQERLAKLFTLRVEDVGVAGMKDRWACTTQTFSLPRDFLAKDLRTQAALATITEVLRSNAAECGWEPPKTEAAWHRSKLKRGQLVGNKFEIVVSRCNLASDKAVTRAHEIAKALRTFGGWPNYYGPQRFGHGGSSATRGRGILYERLRIRPPCVDASCNETVEASTRTESEPPAKKQKRKRRAPWLETLYFSAFQSALFNAWLALRIERGFGGLLVCGDRVCSPQTWSKPRLVKPHSAMATAETAAAECAEKSAAASEPPGRGNAEVPQDAPAESAPSSNAERPKGGGNCGTFADTDWTSPPSESDTQAFTSGEITYAGPMYGGQMARAFGRAGELDEEVWGRLAPGIGSPEKIKSSLLCGGRRAALLPVPSDLCIEPHTPSDGVRFCFSLPAGAYATSFLREFMRVDDDIMLEPPEGVKQGEDDEDDELLISAE
eukprot:TRINITY_DN72482_c0_g1_i1.p1 TRINITY_DN72482_c0_g1~~TRINITY_DN72482_c0_g1_i1.p1  ORF type:complete len:509 (-),score=72.47 TRINITY_DN72482_c0_g1_i1:450-1937(-)